nr:immunoglobulin heavy chain junction region [Mus musculus]
LCSSLVCLL